MSEQNQTDSTAPYDPDKDADTQPESLNPRTDERASGAGEGAEEDVYEDTDADPANLNPRSTLDDDQT